MVCQLSFSLEQMKLGWVRKVFALHQATPVHLLSWVVNLIWIATRVRSVVRGAEVEGRRFRFVSRWGLGRAGRMANC